jgi:hypothetical protein
MSAYAVHRGMPVRYALLIEVGDWLTGMDDSPVGELFGARRAMAFAALSERRLFQQGFGYCNFDSYSMIVQRYKPGETGTFAFMTRRRDGGTQQVWSSDGFAFQRPNHVDAQGSFAVDGNLLGALLRLQPDAHGHFLEAITEFSLANTDSSDVPEHVEVVMTKSAFEWLFEIDEKASSFVESLHEALADIPTTLPTESQMSAWSTRWSGAKRPLEAWARDFCFVRGSAAHGKDRVSGKPVWSGFRHLGFAALLFPLLVKKKLTAAGLMTMADIDKERLGRIDWYLMHDPLKFDMLKDRVHPWNDLDTHALIRAHAHHLYK